MLLVPPPYLGTCLSCPAPAPQVFERTWFARRRCLDVGCNEGLITLALAQRYHPRSMLGVDIDGALIARACRWGGVGGGGGVAASLACLWRWVV